MKPNHAHGFTMLEVLVAILVLSLGLLGLAGLQTIGLRNSSGSSQRTIATQLAYDIADRMRANYASVISGDYNYANYVLLSDLAPAPPLTPNPNRPATAAPAGLQTANCYNAAFGCTPVQLAYQDLYDWNQQICAQLPQSSSCITAVTNATVPWGVVCIDSTPNDGTPAAPACDNALGAPYVIKIWWIEDRNNPVTSLKRWVTPFNP